MEEKVIIKGKPGKPILLLVIAASLIVLSLGLIVLNVGNIREIEGETSIWMHPTIFQCLYFAGLKASGALRFICPIMFNLGLLFIVVWIIVMLAFKKVSLTVTNKRVYGTAAWGKRVDLPLDKISAVSTSFWKGIGVSTSSGIIKFKFIQNNNEIHSEISKLLLERQQNKSNPIEQEKKPEATSATDELKKFKELLDSGVITQEEFDAKKKQLMGL